MTAIIGDCRTVLPTLEAGSVQACVTSPPYWGLRDYDVAGQLGLEATPDEYVAALVEVFREVRRVLRPDGTLWLNLGDCYITNPKGPNGADKSTLTNPQRQARIPRPTVDPKAARRVRGQRPHRYGEFADLKHKDLVGIPWRVAFALQDDGWWLRQDIIWHKPNPMPESVTDRCTKSHEYLFLLSKSEHYQYDAAAIAEPSVTGVTGVTGGAYAAPGQAPHANARGEVISIETTTRNARSVWTIATTPYAGAHFATMPPELAKRCILAGSRIGDVVLDPFLGSGTVGMVAEQNGRRWVGCELQPKYEPLIKERTAQVGLFGRAG